MHILHEKACTRAAALLTAFAVNRAGFFSCLATGFAGFAGFAGSAGMPPQATRQGACHLLIDPKAWQLRRRWLRASAAQMPAHVAGINRSRFHQKT